MSFITSLLSDNRGYGSYSSIAIELPAGRCVGLASLQYLLLRRLSQANAWTATVSRWSLEFGWINCRQYSLARLLIFIPLGGPEQACGTKHPVVITGNMPAYRLSADAAEPACHFDQARPLYQSAHAAAVRVS